MSPPPAASPVRFAIRYGALGYVLVAASDKGIRALFIGPDPDRLVSELDALMPSRRDPSRELDALLDAALALVEAPHLPVPLPLDPLGTPFQHRVWDALRAIPPGALTTYAALARDFGTPGAVRAIGSACARNPIAVAIPCHRVVRSDGALAGYRWGLDLKRELLRREALGAHRHTPA